MARGSNGNRNNSNQSSRSRSSGRSSDKPMMSQWGDTARDKPLATAAAAAGAVAAGVFLWSKRNRIGDQISRISGQVSDWAGDMRSGNSSRSLAATDVPSAPKVRSRTNSPRVGSGGSRSTGSSGSESRGMSETGGGNASLGAHTGSTGIGAAS